MRIGSHEHLSEDRGPISLPIPVRPHRERLKAELRDVRRAEVHHGAQVWLSAPQVLDAHVPRPSARIDERLDLTTEERCTEPGGKAAQHEPGEGITERHNHHHFS